VWERDSDRVKLLVESGLDAKKQPIGVPYGSIARMILLYLQTQAVRTRSREVDSFPNNAPVCKTGFAVRPPRPNTLSAQGIEVVSDSRGPMVLLEARIRSADDRFPTRLWRQTQPPAGFLGP
jgi:hypothetical protein